MRGPFLLVAAETFARGWRVEAPGRDTPAVRHLAVDGYANGWRIPWSGSYTLTIEYGPERAARIARRLDLVAVPLGTGAALAAAARPPAVAWQPAEDLAHDEESTPSGAST